MSKMKPIFEKQKNNLNWIQKVRKVLEEGLIFPVYSQPIVSKFECLVCLRDEDKIISSFPFWNPLISRAFAGSYKNYD